MARFKPVPRKYLVQKMLKFFGNLVKNYNGFVYDSGFFNVIVNTFDQEKGVELVQTAYDAAALAAMGERRSRLTRLDLSDGLDDIFQALWNNEKARGTCREVLKNIVALVQDDLAREPRKKKGKGETNVDAGANGETSETLEQRFNELARALRLSDLEAEILLVAYLQSETCFNWPTRIDDRDKQLFFAMALDRSLAEVMAATSPKGTLRKFNLLDDDFDYNGRTLGGFLDGGEEETLQRRFYGKNDSAEILPWEFFGDLGAKDGAVLEKMLRANPGKCNILLYGAPGTGKTSFARALAKRLGRTAWEVRQGDTDGRNMKSEARLVGIRVCNNWERPDESLMIIDEADELLRGGQSIFDLLFGGENGGKSTEKGVVNTLLDEMNIPAVWISNTPARSMDPSVRRRFDYSICFEELNTRQRTSIWRNTIAKLGLGDLISEAQVQTYAATYATNAGGISLVLENVKRMKPAPQEVDALVATLMKPHCKLLGVKDENRFLPAKDYSLDGLNIKGDLALPDIVGAVHNYLDVSFAAAAEDRPRMNLLLFGAPGTGKTEFVKYLGQQLDRKVLVLKGSDLLSKYVGESEQNIAAAFRRAEAEHAILFLDEVDGLLQSRENARASWEISQVNELLQQMENFGGVMVAATNFRKNLDPAVMRRFTFKLEFDYLDDAGKKTFFERMFKTSLTEAECEELKQVGPLAPGDYRTVRQKQYYLANQPTNAARIAALREECALKTEKSAQGASIGFAA